MKLDEVKELYNEWLSEPGQPPKYFRLEGNRLTIKMEYVPLAEEAEEEAEELWRSHCKFVAKDFNHQARELISWVKLGKALVFIIAAFAAFVAIARVIH